MTISIDEISRETVRQCTDSDPKRLDVTLRLGQQRSRDTRVNKPTLTAIQHATSIPWANIHDDNRGQMT
jgi:hypothetical protein